MHKANLDPKDVVALYKQGCFVSNIAAMLHTSKPRIKKILADEGIEVSNAGLRRDVSEEELEAMAKEYNNGTNMEALAKKYHVRIKKLRKLFKEHGVVINKWRNHVKKEKVKIERPIKPKYDGPYKVCPYCGWKTKDVENKSHAYGIHLRHQHNLDLKEHLKQYPEDEPYLADMVARREGKVQCKICGEWRCLIDNRHLAKHGITKLEYIAKYGDNSLVSQDTMEKLRECINKMQANKDWVRQESSFEKSIKQLLESHNIEYIEHDRKILDGLEIDFLIGNLGIEFNGNQFHTEWFGGKDKHYHINKTINAKKKGINLIHIFQDEYELHQDIVEEKILTFLHRANLVKVGARKCEIVELNADLAEMFLTVNHIQGFTYSTVYLGAIYAGELIGVMSFLNEGGGNWNLTRFCTKLYHSCQGLASKMLHYFKENYQWSYIKTFLDRRFCIDENNNVYTKIGFTLERIIPPDYSYYNCRVDKTRRFHKFSLRKKALSKRYGFPMEMTETEMAKAAGYDRIWNCGLLKYSMFRNQNNNEIIEEGD